MDIEEKEAIGTWTCENGLTRGARNEEDEEGAVAVVVVEVAGGI